MADILVQGLTKNNLKHVTFRIPKEKITVFTGVSGSGKSSIVFDTIAAESQRQMNATYPAFVRSRLPKYPKPAVERIDNLTPSVVVDQSHLGGNARSTVRTISGLYASLRLLFSRIGKPYVGTASYFSFNDPNGMCKTCSGLGKITRVDVEAILDLNKSWNQGCVKDSLYRPGSWYWKQYTQSGMFDLNKPIREYSGEEYNLLLYGSRDGKSGPDDAEVTGLYHKYTKTLLNRDISNKSRHTQEKSQSLVAEMECTDCHGQRLNEAALNCRINGYSIADLCGMELTQLRGALSQITDRTCGGKGVVVTELAFMDPIVTECEHCGGVRYNRTYRGKNIVELLGLTASQALEVFEDAKIRRRLKGMQQVGLSYLTLGQPLSTLSGGERQRIKLAKNLGKRGGIIVMDEPTTGLHMSDIQNLLRLFDTIVARGNTLVVIEHNLDLIKQADWIIDIGPDGGNNGGEVVFTGTPAEMVRDAKTLTADSLRASCT